MVQPDLCVVCDAKKLDARGCIGPPDWIIKILSPSTAQKDLRDKFEVYEFAGVQEYWIVHSHEQTLLVYRRNASGTFVGAPRPYVVGDQVAVGIIEGVSLDLKQVFGEVPSAEQ